MEVLSKTGIHSVTPTVSASVAYTAGDQVGGLQTLSAIAGRKDRGITLINVSVVDKAAQSAELTILFFSSQPTLTSADNEAFSLADAEMAKCIGSVTLPAANYVSSAANSVGTLLAADCCLALRPATTDGTLYAAVKTTGTPTYASTGDLIFNYHFMQDL